MMSYLKKQPKIKLNLADLAIEKTLNIFYNTRTNSWHVLTKPQDALIKNIVNYGETTWGVYLINKVQNNFYEKVFHLNTLRGTQSTG